MVQTNDSVAWIELNNGKANAIDSELLAQLQRELDSAVESGARAAVLTGYESFFSAGLNLKTLPDSRDGMESFIRDFEETMLRVYSFELPLVCAVNGHAIAGGCILASCGDRRVGATGRHRLGVSEVSLGIVFPSIAFEIMRATLTPTSASDVLLGGTLLTPGQALEAGMLHRLVEPDELRDACSDEAAALAEKPEKAFRHTKLALRAPGMERAATLRDENRRLFLETWFSDDVKARRQAMLEKS